jgi:acyl dehydratase
MTIDADVVRKFAEITGDYNPLHFEEAFAAKTRFRRLIAQGGLATGLLHALVAMDLPGAGSVFVRQSWKFPKPVYIGDTITAVGTIKSVQAKRAMAEMEFRVTNQSGDVVLEGDALVYQADASG